MLLTLKEAHAPFLGARSGRLLCSPLHRAVWNPLLPLGALRCCTRLLLLGALVTRAEALLLLGAHRRRLPCRLLLGAPRQIPARLLLLGAPVTRIRTLQLLGALSPFLR